MATLTLKGSEPTKDQPSSIAVSRTTSSTVIAVIYCDQRVSAQGVDLLGDELKEILTIMSNFWLFYRNIPNTEF